MPNAWFFPVQMHKDEADDKSGGCDLGLRTSNFKDNNKLLNIYVIGTTKWIELGDNATVPAANI